jgi:hypothetical protein
LVCNHKAKQDEGSAVTGERLAYLTPNRDGRQEMNSKTTKQYKINIGGISSPEEARDQIGALEAITNHVDGEVCKQLLKIMPGFPDTAFCINWNWDFGQQCIEGGVRLRPQAREFVRKLSLKDLENVDSSTFLRWSTSFIGWLLVNVLKWPKDVASSKLSEIRRESMIEVAGSEAVDMEDGMMKSFSNVFFSVAKAGKKLSLEKDLKTQDKITEKVDALDGGFAKKAEQARKVDNAEEIKPEEVKPETRTMKVHM